MRNNVSRKPTNPPPPYRFNAALIIVAQARSIPGNANPYPNFPDVSTGTSPWPQFGPYTLYCPSGRITTEKSQDDTTTLIDKLTT